MNDSTHRPASSGPDAPVVGTMPTRSDLGTLAALALALPFAAALPARALAKLSRRAAPLFAPGYAKKADAGTIEEALGVPSERAREISRASLGNRVLAMLLFLRARLYGRHFDVSVDGLEHVERALARGRGAVLWIGELTYAPDACKIALHEAGHAVAHLSRAEHGFSSSRFGMRWLNPLRSGYELRYLEKRIMIDPDDPSAARDAMNARLAGNGLVSILASGHVGRSLLAVPFLGKSLRMAGGAPTTARFADSVLLPVFAVPDPDVPRMRVEIGAPIPLDGEDRKVAVRRATTRFAELLEQRVRRHPELWLQWRFLEP